MIDDLFKRLSGYKLDIQTAIDEDGWIDVGNEIACLELFPMSKYVELLENRVLELEASKACDGCVYLGYDEDNDNRASCHHLLQCVRTCGDLYQER